MTSFLRRASLPVWGSSGSSHGASPASKPAASSPGNAHAPSDKELAQLLAATRAAFAAADETERLLAIGGEEGLTDANLER
jgi:hypothetical protein